MCFSAQWLETILIDLVIIGAIFAILRVVIPFVLSQLGVGAGVVTQVINIVLWAIVAIIVIWIAFALIGCLAGTNFSLLPPHR